MTLLLACFLLVLARSRRNIMPTRTKKEALQLANTYRKELELIGCDASTFPISDEWGDITTIAGLLIQNPTAWQHLLTDAKIDGVYNVILYWFKGLKKIGGKMIQTPVHVVIPDGSETFQILWKAMTEQGVVLEIFPGVADIPRGIKGILVASSEEEPMPLEEGMTLVRVSNGFTIRMPEKNVCIITPVKVETS